MKELYLKHYGTKRHSGRYPWGSGDNPYQHDKMGFYRDYTAMKEKGMSEGQIAKYIDDTYFGGQKKFATTQLRAWVTLGKEEQMAANISRVTELKAKGMSNVAIGKEMGVPESTVRTWLDPARKEKLSATRNVAEVLKKEVEQSKYLDVGKSNEIMLNCSKQRMDAAIKLLEEEGYKKHYIQVEQQGNLGNYTSLQVLTKDDVPYKEVYQNRDQIKLLSHFQSNDGGKTIEEVGPPRSISSSRVKINYLEEGGIKKDGLMQIRPGVKELSLGNDPYAQVRIAVDGTSYLKGMAVYGDPKDFPKGVDIIFNTNKSVGTPMINVDDPDHQVLKSLKKDKDMPFGSLTKSPDNYISEDGTVEKSAINKVNSDEDWEKWSKNLASQFLSKQPNQLAKQQLGIAYDIKSNEFENLKKIDNPTIKKKLLEEFADECDSASVHMKAAPLSGQATHVILPLDKIKDNEIYAPNYETGEEVVLVRYPHAGPFESPRLKVNNNNAEGRSVLGNAKHAVGINSNVAEQLSGADFDGDTVVVIPVRGQNIKTRSALDELKDFEPKVQYKAYDGMPRVGKEDTFNKGLEMGKVSNLITDMTVAGAPDSDIAKAVKHSMVVIDAEKHNLNWKQSYKDNNIAYLQSKYQKKGGGASTIISKATSQAYVSKRKELMSPNMMTDEEKERWYNGEKVYRNKEEYYIKPSNKKAKDMTDAELKGFYEARNEYNAKLKEYNEAKAKDPNAKISRPDAPAARNGIKFTVVERKEKTTKMAKETDARNLISPHNTIMENIYANYANNMKSLALDARKEARATGNMVKDPVAAKTYKNEVDSIKNKIKLSKLNAPKERQAQAIANKRMDVYIKENPDLTKEEIKKKRNKVLAEARAQAGTDRQRVTLTDKEVEAIKAGAVSNATMLDIFNNGDQDALKKSFTPKTQRGMTRSQIAKAKRLLNAGYTQAEVADALGFSVSTIVNNVDF